jgi:hypothetical protein
VNRFGEDADQGLLLRFSKYQELWVGEGDDLVEIMAQNMVFFFVCLEQLLRKKKGYKYPPLTVGVQLTPTIFGLGPEKAGLEEHRLLLGK